MRSRGGCPSGQNVRANCFDLGTRSSRSSTTRNSSVSSSSSRASFSIRSARSVAARFNPARAAAGLPRSSDACSDAAVMRPGTATRSSRFPVRTSRPLHTSFAARSTATSTARLLVEVTRTLSPSSQAFATAFTTSCVLPVPGGPVTTVRGSLRRRSSVSSCDWLDGSGAARGPDGGRLSSFSAKPTGRRCAAAVIDQSFRVCSCRSSSRSLLVYPDHSATTEIAAL